MATLADLVVRLSGGAANTDPNAALGGIMSTVVGGLVDSRTPSAPTTITGVTINDAPGNAKGTGTLTWDSTLQTLRWTDPGGQIGTAIDVSVNGDYAIQGANDGGLLNVTVVAASLPSGDLTNTITITELDNNLFDDVLKAESLSGDSEYRCVYMENQHAADSMVDVKVWIENNTPGQDTIAIQLDPVGLNGVAVIIATEKTAPVGVDFDAVNPIDEASSLSMGTLAFGDQFPMWIKRLVPANTSAQQLDNEFRLAMKISV